MPDRVLSFVTEADGSPPAGHRVIVLSPWWTSGPDPEAGVTSVRSHAEAVLRNLDLLATSTARLDRWAEEACVPELFVLDGVGWWDRVRMALRWDMYELVLWRSILAELGGADAWDRVIVPADRPHLVAACKAVGLADRLVMDEPAAVPVAASVAPPAAAPALAPVPAAAEAPRRPTRRRGPGWRAVRRLRSLARRATRRPPVPPPPPPPYEERLAALDRRVRDQARRRGILVVAWAGAYQVIEAGKSSRKADPFLDPAVQRLRRRRGRVTVAVQGINLRRVAEWRAVEADAGCIPQAFVTHRWGGSPEPAAGAEGLEERVRERSRHPLDVAGADLAPALADVIAGYAGDWLLERHQLTRAIGGFLDVLRPRAVLLDREGTRLPWMAAARSRGIPVVSTQHGMIYAGNPEYFRPSTTGTIRPDRTCVFGTWERDLLVERAGYADEEVVVTGSPRVMDLRPPALSAASRSSTRRELGVADGDRMLVASAAHGTIGELLTACMLASVLDGSLPGVHIVVKVHPQDASPADIAGFLAGLAAAGDRPAPRVTVVRDIGLERLLGAADAHLGGSSTMLTDAVAAGLPNMVAMGQAGADPLGYVAAGVAVPVRSVEDVRAVMTDPRPPTPEARLAFLGQHFLPGDSTGRLAQVVLDMAKAADGTRTAGTAP